MKLDESINVRACRLSGTVGIKKSSAAIVASSTLSGFLGVVFGASAASQLVPLLTTRCQDLLLQLKKATSCPA